MIVLCSATLALWTLLLRPALAEDALAVARQAACIIHSPGARRGDSVGAVCGSLTHAFATQSAN